MSSGQIPPLPFRRVLVTGAAGFIGSSLVDRLLADGAEVTGLDCFDDFYDPALKHRNIEAAQDHPRFRLVAADLRNRKVLAPLLREEGGFDVVVHLAARAGVRPSLEDPVLYYEVNVLGALALLEELKTQPQTRFVFASSSSVYGGLQKAPFREEDEASRPVSPYAASKKSGEVLCFTYHHLYGLPVTALRFFTVYGPRQRPEMAIARFARCLLDGLPIRMYGDGSSARDYTFVDDIVDGIVRAMERTRGYEIYNLGEEATTRLDELIALLGEVLGVEPRIDRQPLQPGDVPLTCASVAKARRLLGYRPSTPVREGLARYAAWLAAQEREAGAPGR